MLSLGEIKEAIQDGERVFWKNNRYIVVKDSIGQYLIHCIDNDCYWGLTHKDGITMNGKQDEFYIVN